MVDTNYRYHSTFKTLYVYSRNVLWTISNPLPWINVLPDFEWFQNQILQSISFYLQHMYYVVYVFRQSEMESSPTWVVGWVTDRKRREYGKPPFEGCFWNLNNIKAAIVWVRRCFLKITSFQDFNSKSTGSICDAFSVSASKCIHSRWRVFIFSVNCLVTVVSFGLCSWMLYEYWIG